MVHKIRKHTRRTVYGMTGYRCWYCGTKAETVDHAIPLSRGGSKRMHNLRACCDRCNQKKANRTVEEFREWVMRPGNHNIVILTDGQFFGERLHADRQLMVATYPIAEKLMAALS